MTNTEHKLLDKLLYDYMVTRDIYYSEFTDKVIDQKTWEEIRDNNHAQTIKALLAWKNEQVRKAEVGALEWVKSKDIYQTSGHDILPNMSVWVVKRKDLDNRIKELRTPKKGKL